MSPTKRSNKVFSLDNTEQNSVLEDSGAKILKEDDINPLRDRVLAKEKNNVHECGICLMQFEHGENIKVLNCPTPAQINKEEAKEAFGE